MAALRQAFPALRQMSLLRVRLDRFDFYGAGYEAAGLRLKGQTVAWSRIPDDEDVLCLFSFHGTQSCGADVMRIPSWN